MDAARIMLTANPGYDPNLMEHGMLTSLWRLHTYITTELTVTVQGTLPLPFFVFVFCSAPTMSCFTNLQSLGVVRCAGKNYGFADLCVNVTLLGVTGCYQFNPLGTFGRHCNCQSLYYLSLCAMSTTRLAAFWPAGLGPGVFQRPSYNVGAAVRSTRRPSTILEGLAVEAMN
jgi:hypothetical protein